MIRYYKGKEPCPGCGCTGEERPRFDKNGLCQKCKSELEIGRAISEERGLQRQSYSFEELTRCFLTWYSVPIERIDGALRKLLRTFSRFDQKYANGREDINKQTYYNGGTSHDTFVLPTDTVDAAKELYEAINDVARNLNKEKDNYRKVLEEEFAAERDKIYNEGVAHGRNLLMQLNNGEITADQFIAPAKYKRKNN